MSTLYRHAINRVLAIDNNMLASGDDEGVVRMWDMRKPDKHVREYHDNEDYISHLEMASDGRTLVATG
jgi:WD40 repeat protein